MTTAIIDNNSIQMRIALKEHRNGETKFVLKRDTVDNGTTENKEDILRCYIGWY